MSFLKKTQTEIVDIFILYRHSLKLDIYFYSLAFCFNTDSQIPFHYYFIKCTTLPELNCI